MKTSQGGERQKSRLSCNTTRISTAIPPESKQQGWKGGWERGGWGGRGVGG